MKGRVLVVWLGFVACLVAAVLAALGRDAAAEAAAPALGRSGLAPMPGDAEVPLAWMPPGAQVEPIPSEEIFPPQTITIRFNHQKHVEGLSLSCKVCHAAAYTSMEASDRLLPKPAETCDNCHEVDHANPARVKITAPPGAAAHGPSGECAFCHTGSAAGEGGLVAQIDRAGAQPALPPREAPRPQHPVRPVPRAGEQARAGDARPAAAHGRLLHLPRDERRGAGRGQGRLHHLPLGAAGRARPDGLRHADPRSPGLAARRRPRRRLDRAPQVGRRRRLELLRDVPHVEGLHGLPRRQRAPPQGAPERLALDARAGRPHGQPALHGLPPGADVLRRLPSSHRRRPGLPERRPADGPALPPRRPRSGRRRRGGRTTTRGRRCAT